MSQTYGYRGKWVGLLVLAGLAFGVQVRAQNCDNDCKQCCPPPYKYHPEGSPRIKYKYGCPKPICDFCHLPHYGYYQTCWHPWPFPPDWSHCPVPPPGELVQHPPAGPGPKQPPQDMGDGSAARASAPQPIASSMPRPQPLDTQPEATQVRPPEVKVGTAPVVKPAPEWLPPPSDPVRPEKPAVAQSNPMPVRPEPASSTETERTSLHPEPTTPVPEVPTPAGHDQPAAAPPAVRTPPALETPLVLPDVQPQTGPAPAGRMPVGPNEPRPLPIQEDERKVMPYATDEPMTVAPEVVPSVTPIDPPPTVPVPSRADFQSVLPSAVEAPMPEPIRQTSAEVTADEPQRPRKAIGAANVRMVNSKRIVLDYNTADLGGKDALLELWYTQDGRAWHKDPTQVKSGAPYMIEVNREGTYGFTLMARKPSDHGRGPAAGDQPQVWVEVDWSKPTVHLVDVRAGAHGHPRNVSVLWIATDSNLKRQPITLSWSEKVDGPWKSFATNLENAGRYTWLVPNDVPSHIYVRVEAFDAVGNVGATQTPTPVVIPSPE